MNRFEAQTAVRRIADGKYRGEVSTDWKMWVPVGGYLASIALRAVQGETAMARPASLTCHYLGEATFDPVEVEVTQLRTMSGAESYRARMTQGDVTVLEALVWATPTGVVGPLANWLPAPEVPPAGELEDIVLDDDVVALMGDEPFWNNFEIRPVRLGHPAAYDDHTPKDVDPRLLPRRHARVRAWDRFMDGDSFEDPWLDACRYLVITDISQFPTVATPFTPPLPFIAPTLDLTVYFHGFAPDEEWLLIEGNGSFAGDGLLGCESRLWAPDGALLATGSSHMVFRDLSGLSATQETSDSAWFETVDA